MNTNTSSSQSDKRKRRLGTRQQNLAKATRRTSTDRWQKPRPLPRSDNWRWLLYIHSSLHRLRYQGGRAKRPGTDAVYGTCDQSRVQEDAYSRKLPQILWEINRVLHGQCGRTRPCITSTTYRQALWFLQRESPTTSMTMGEKWRCRVEYHFGSIRTKQGDR